MEPNPTPPLETAQDASAQLRPRWDDRLRDQLVAAAVREHARRACDHPRLPLGEGAP